MNVFLYGTLLDSVLRDRLFGRVISTSPAVLPDYTVLRHTDGPLPALVARTGMAASGIILHDCTPADMARLDAYEAPFGYSQTTVDVSSGTQIATASTYMPDTSVSISGQAWSLQEWQDSAAPLSREMMREIGAYEPALTGAALRQQWHMIAVRAGARLRAAADETPTALRTDPQAGAFKIEPVSQLAGGFFKFSGFQVAHQSFQNEMLGPLDREILLGCDAAIVLPYDPRTDRVLLVEQIRMGPLMRRVANPWTLEPVAGIIDGHETTEQAALRETEEEAGLKDVILEKMFSCYASPGSTTDYFYCYAALGPLPAPSTYTGGLAEENEDLRLHILPFEDALQLVDTGEANAGPLIAMLLWLARHKDRLQAAA